jgi:outer membrane protein
MKLLALSLVFVGVVAIPDSVEAVQPGDALSLSDAVATAIEHHPSMRSAQLALDAATIRVDEIRARRLPNVRLSESITHGNNPVFVFGSLLEQARFGPQNFSLSALNGPQSVTNFRTTLAVDVPAFDRMKRKAQIGQAAEGREQAELGRTGSEQGVRREVIGAYFGLLAAGATRDASREGVRMAESDVQRTRDRVEAGLAVRSDLLSAQVQLAELKHQQILAEGNLLTAEATLNVLMGVSTVATYRLTTPLDEKQFPVGSTEQLFGRALERRTDYLRRASLIESARQGVVERRSEYLPDVKLFGDIGTSGRTIGRGSMDFTIGASLTFTLFDRARGPGLDLSEIQRSVAETERDRIADQIRIEVIGAVNSYRAAQQQLDVASTAADQSAEAVRIVRDRYDEGLATVTDVLRAEAAFVAAKTAMIASRHRHYVAYANVLLATGELTNVQPFEP